MSKSNPPPADPLAQPQAAPAVVPPPDVAYLVAEVERLRAAVLVTRTVAPPLQPEWVRPTAAATLLGVGRRCVNNWIEDGRLEATRLANNVTLVSVASIHALIEAGRVQVVCSDTTPAKAVV